MATVAVARQRSDIDKTDIVIIMLCVANAFSTVACHCHGINVIPIICARLATKMAEAIDVNTRVVEYMGSSDVIVAVIDMIE